MTNLTKPVRRSVAAKLPHGYAETLIITIYPGAVVEVREPRRRVGVQFDLAEMYVKSLIREAWGKGAKKRRAR